MINHETSERKMTRSEYSRLGAMALNSDPVKKRASILKGLETRKRNQLKIKLAELSDEPIVSAVIEEAAIAETVSKPIVPIITEWEKLLINKKDNR